VLQIPDREETRPPLCEGSDGRAYTEHELGVLVGDAAIGIETRAVALRLYYWVASIASPQVGALTPSSPGSMVTFDLGEPSIIELVDARAVSAYAIPLNKVEAVSVLNNEATVF
jgi:hypothetical protein